MITKVDRKYLEIDSPDKINISEKPQNSCKIEKKIHPIFKSINFFISRLVKVIVGSID